MSAIPCPCCDMERLEMAPITALALGTALGATQFDQHRITEMMCTKHRVPWVMAMIEASRIAEEEPRVEP